MVARFEAAAITATGGGGMESAHAREGEKRRDKRHRDEKKHGLTASSAFLYARFSVATDRSQAKNARRAWPPRTPPPGPRREPRSEPREARCSL